MSSKSSHANTHRRIFRGRGKNKDGNLPQRPHKRMPKLKQKNDYPNKPNDKYAADDAFRLVHANSKTNAIENDTKISSNMNDGMEMNVTTMDVAMDVAIDVNAKDVDVKVNVNVNVIGNANANVNVNLNVNDEINEIEKNAKNEMKQLSKRIWNIRESIQLSADAISNPSTWEQNVLNAVSNCCHTWQSILSYYFVSTISISSSSSSSSSSTNETMSVYTSNHDDPDTNSTEGGNHVSNSNSNRNLQTNDTFAASINLQKTIKEISLDIYGLVQMAMQTGPLVGSSPGYFKRCGSNVANMALHFLQSLPITISNSLIPYPSNNFDNGNDSNGVNVSTNSNNVNHSNDSNRNDTPQSNKLGLDSNLLLNLGFSLKQMTAISKWYTNAEKCVKANVEPSKSMQKKQTLMLKKQTKTKTNKNKSKKRKNKG